MDSTENSKGKLLIWGNGEDYRPKLYRDIFFAVGTPVFWFFLLPGFFDMAFSGTDSIFTLFVLGFMAWMIYDAYNSYRKTQTNVAVYENVVEGAGIGKDSSSVQEFSLTYMQLSNATCDEEALTINTSGANFICYCNNASQIQITINEKLQQIK
ncbi:MAG: hypothetical protein FWD19_04660 [Defluviitaleaceae bacterium]|nr:hypothetical protein [Defluviitaleaceae bacterium]